MAPQSIDERTEKVEWGAMTEHGLHHPVLGRRRPGSTLALLRRSRDLWAIYGKRRLDPVFREEIMLAVAGADSCRQCSFAHREWARAVGITEADLAALEGLDTSALEERRWTAFAWGQAYARSDLTDVPEFIDADFRRRFSAQEQADIELAARAMYWMNETSNSADAGTTRLRGDPVLGSTALSELVAAVMYVLFVPILVILLSIAQRRGLLAMLRDIRPFFREFERRGPNTISGPGVKYVG